MDQLTLKRTITGEYAPRLYQMTGGAFNAMKDAVKARPGARFDGTLKAWAIKGDDIKALKEQGYAIEQEPDFRLRNWEREGTPTEATFILDFEYRDTSGTWSDFPYTMKRSASFSGGDQHRAYIQEVAAEMKRTFERALGGKRDMDAIKRGFAAVQEAVKRG